MNNQLSPFEESNYENLTKAIAGYNQGFGPARWSNFSLPEAIKLMDNLVYTATTNEAKCANYTNDDKRRCLGYLYAIGVKQNVGANLPLASYQWRTTATVNGIQQDVCFYYGEQDWLAQSWADKRDQEIIAGNVACP